VAQVVEHLLSKYKAEFKPQPHKKFKIFKDDALFKCVSFLFNSEAEPFYLFIGVRKQTQGLMHARQML
jgi:hypothetical protein